MKTKILIILAVVFCAQLVSAQSTAITYQGRLTDNGSPATGSYELKFTIYDTVISPGGNVIGQSLTVPAVGVTNGLFTVALDFGAGVFNGEPRWLQTGVRTNGSAGVFITLLPRQSITATPYAIQAAGLSGTLPDSQLTANIARLNGSNFFNGPVNFSPASGAPFAITGSSSNKLVKGLNADKLGGKSATDFVLKAGDTMTGPLNLPANGLAAGGSQLILSNGNVGIGTAAPASALHVDGVDVRFVRNNHPLVLNADAGGVGTRAEMASDLALAFAPGNTERMRINPNGAVGIGTASPEAALHVRGGSVNISLSRVDGSPVAYISGHPAYYGGNGTMVLYPTNGIGSVVLASAGDSYLNGGNVGIGTASPGRKLDVAGDIRVDNLNSIGWWNSANAGGSGPGYYAARIAKSDAAYAGDMEFFVRYGGDTAETKAMTISSPASGVGQVTVNGRVGIGGGGGAERLSVDGSIGLALAGAVENESAALIPSGLQHDDFLYDGAYLHHYGFGFHLFEDPLGPPFEGINSYVAGFFGIDLFTGGANRVRISRGGDVGIGTGTPQAKLHVSGGNVLIGQDYFLLGGNAHGGFEQLIRSRGMGYDIFGYPGVQIGQERDHIALFIDPRSVAGGAFDGSIENEIMTPNKFIIRQANRNGDNWLLGPTFDDGKVGIGTENPIDALSLGFGRSMSFDANDSAQTSRLRWRYQGTEYEWIERPHVSGGLAFGTDKFERMRIDGYGNVGIGTTTPWAKLTVAGKASPYQVYHDDPVLLLSNTNALRVADEGVSLGFNRDSHFLYGAIKGAASNADPNLFDGYLAFFTTDLTSYHAEHMRILGNGNVGIGTTTPSEALSVVGKTYISGPLAGGDNATLTVRGGPDASNGRLVHLYAPWGTEFNTDRYFMVGFDATGNGKFQIRGDGAYIQSSSRELKTAIKPIAKPLDILTALQGVYYKWKGATDSQQNAGFIAEDIAEVFPEASGADKKAVNYPAVIPLLVEGVKELDAKLAKLDQRTKHIATVDADGVALAAIQGLNEVVKEKETEIQGLKQQNGALETRLAELEKLVHSLAQKVGGQQ